jgi:hypothetical protein
MRQIRQIAKSKPHTTVEMEKRPEGRFSGEARINSSWIRGAWLGMGCKAVFAANIENICKKTNAADRPSQVITGCEE